MKKLAKLPIYIRLPISLLVCYFIVSVVVYFYADHAIFPAPKSSYHDNQMIIKIPSNNGIDISAIYLKVPKSKYTIIYSHGNSEDIGRIFPFLRLLTMNGYSVIAYDYPGYGTSGGKASEHNTYLAANAVYNYVKNVLNIPDSHIILFGFSLGSGPTVNLAAKHNVAGVILQSAFLSTYRVVTYFKVLPFDQFDNVNKINMIHEPILFIHGKQDNIVPVWHGYKLYEKANSPKAYYWVKNANHNNILYKANEKYWEVINSFVKSLPYQK